MFGGFLLLGGRAGDLFGRRRLFLIGVAIFSFASLLNGLATSDTWLVAARGLQGLGGALVSPAALSIITTTFAEGEDRTKALGVWSAIAAGGRRVRPAARRHPDRPPELGVDLLRQRPDRRRHGAARDPLRAGVQGAAIARGGVDLPGAVTVTAGLIVLVYAIVKAEDFGWGSAETLGLAAIAFALLAAFVVIEQRSAAPLIRLGIFRVRSLAGANAVLLLVVGGLFAFFFFASLYVQQILGYSPLEAGLAFLPGDGRHRHRRRRSPSSSSSASACASTAVVGHGDRRLRPVPVLGRRRSTAPTSSDVLPGGDPAVDRHGADLRPDHADRDHERRRRGRRPRVGPVQHLAAGRRRARAGRALDARGGQDRERAGGAGPPRRAPVERASALLDGFQVAFVAAAVLVASAPCC